MGVSLGAVATLQAAAESGGYSALVLDSPFASLRETSVWHSWLFFKMPRYPFPSLYLFWFQHITGSDPDSVNAIAALRRAEPVPVLLIASEGDRRMGTEPARALYAESQARVKKLEIFGADVPHGAAARMYPQAYDTVVLAFLEQALQGTESPATEPSK
jgi:pimeloyl-ACP methyl ester carboxylesterase